MMPCQAVLLIDDDELSREVIELYLVADGHHALLAEHGDAALEVLTTLAAPPDLVLSDLHMPGPTGPALLELLRPKLAEGTPAIAMSASQPNPELIRGYASFLLKPFTPEQLREAIASTTTLAAAQAALPGATALGSGLDSAKPAFPSAELAQAPVGELAVLDLAVFNQFASMLQPEQLRELFAMCFAELDKHLGRLRAAVAAGDHEAMRHSAHTIKGSFAVVGARELQRLGAALEAGTGTPADTEASLAEIPLAAERLRGMLGRRGIHLEH